VEGKENAKAIAFDCRVLQGPTPINSLSATSFATSHSKLSTVTASVVQLVTGSCMHFSSPACSSPRTKGHLIMSNGSASFP